MTNQISSKRRQMLTAALAVGTAAPAAATPLTANKSANMACDRSPNSPSCMENGVLRGDLPQTTDASQIGFRQPGPGAVGSNLTAQLSKTIYSSDYATIQQAHDAIVALGGGTLWVVGRHAIDQPFRWDYNKVLISGSQGLGSTLDFSRMTAPTKDEMFAFKLVNQASNKGRKTIQHVTIIGPAADTGISCFSLDSEIGNAITNINFIGVTIINFKTQLYFGSQCSNIYFNMCQFTNSDGPQFKSTTVIRTPAAGTSNSGENWCFTQCQFNNVDKVIENNSGISGGWSFTQCSLVYFNTLFDLRAPCKVTVGSGSHIESNTYSHHWISVKGNGCLVRISHTEFWFAGKVTKEIFRSDPDTVFGGIYLADCDYHADLIEIPYWVDQSLMGPVIVEHWRCQDGIARIPFGKNPGVQQEAWPQSSPNFAATLLSQVGDASTAGISPRVAHEESATQLDTVLAGQEIRRYKRYPIRPGQNIEGSVRIKSNGFAEDGSGFGVYVTIYDAHGLAISGGNPYKCNGDTDYTSVSLNWYPLTPAGAAFYEFRLFAAGSNRNTRRSISIADLVLNTY